MLTVDLAGDERKACVASTRAKDLMIVVGNLNILRGNFKHEERIPFVIELLQTFKERGAYKTFHSEAKAEGQIGAILDSDLPLRTKESDRDPVVKGKSVDSSDASPTSTAATSTANSSATEG
jgi:hypothetical protein